MTLSQRAPCLPASRSLITFQFETTCGFAFGYSELRGFHVVHARHMSLSGVILGGRNINKENKELAIIEETEYIVSLLYNKSYYLLSKLNKLFVNKLKRTQCFFYNFINEEI